MQNISYLKMKTIQVILLFFILSSEPFSKAIIGNELDLQAN